MIYLDKENFNELIKDGVVIVDFYANWCGPCKILSPILDEVSKELKDIKFIKVDVDKHEDIAREYGIMSIPTLIFFKNGEVVNKNIGLINEEKIQEIIDEIE